MKTQHPAGTRIVKFVYDDEGNLIKITGLSKTKARVQKWTLDQVEGLREWHERTMNENGYSADVQMELRVGREQFLGMVLP